MATLNDLKYQKKANEIEIAKNLSNKADLIKHNKLLSNQIKVLEPPKTQKIPKPIKHRASIICHDCKVTFMGKKELVCGNCYSKYKNNILHVITATEEIIFNDYQVEEAEEYLSNITCNLRLDLHGVSTLISPTTPIAGKTCIISFVGKNTKTRLLAVEDIAQRIRCNQISIGFLNFVWKKSNCDPLPGSKAWINNCVKYEDKALFIDDNKSHTDSVKALKLPNLDTDFLETEDPALLIKIINNFVR